MNAKQLFNFYGSHTVNELHSITVEELYEAFRERLLDEITRGQEVSLADLLGSVKRPVRSDES